MVPSFYRLVSFILVATVFHSSGKGEQPGVYQLLPESVQAAVWISDCNDLINRWHRTAIHQLSIDPKIRPFFVEQQELIQNRLMDAGWRLGVKPQDWPSTFKGNWLWLGWRNLTQESPLR